MASKPLKFRILGDASDGKKAFREIADETDSLTDRLSEFGESLGGFATAAVGVAAGVGVAAAGLFVKGFMDGVEAEQLSDQLGAQLGLSADEAERVGGIAADLYRDAWGESLAEVHEAIRLVDQGLKDVGETTDEELSSMTQDALTIADVWDKDLNEVIRAAGALLDTGLASSAGDAFDIITTGLQSGIDLNGDFLDTLFEYSTQFGQAGISAEQMLSALIVGSEAGMMGVDKVGDAVKEMTIRLQDGSDASVDALQAIGLDAEKVMRAFAEGGEAAQQASMDVITALADLEDPLEQNLQAVALLGTPYEDLGELGPEVLAALAEGNLEVASTAGVAETAYDNTATAMEEFKRRGEGALQDFVAGFLAGIGFGDGATITGGINELNDWIEDNEETIIGWGETAGEKTLEILEAINELVGGIEGMQQKWGEFSDEFGEVIDQTREEWEVLSSAFTTAFEFIEGNLDDSITAWRRWKLEITKEINAVIEALNRLPGVDIGAVGSGAVGSGSGSRAGGSNVPINLQSVRDPNQDRTVINLNGDVYGFDDFQQRVVEASTLAARRGVS